MVHYICYMFLTVSEAAFGENYALEFIGGTYSEKWQWKTRGRMASDKTNLRVAPRLGS